LDLFFRPSKGSPIEKKRPPDPFPFFSPQPHRVP
jgi:hypothetical protein